MATIDICDICGRREKVQQIPRDTKHPELSAGENNSPPSCKGCGGKVVIDIRNNSAVENPNYKSL